MRSSKRRCIARLRACSGEPIEFLRPSLFQGPTSNPLHPNTEPMPELVRTFTTAMVSEALFEDLADAFGVPNPLGDGSLATATHPTDHRNLLLRNL